MERTRQDDNLSFCTLRIRKQFVVRYDGGHDGQFGGVKWGPT